VVETTEMPPAEEDEEEDVDETMMTKLTGMPDAEGTRFFGDDDEDEDALTVGAVKVKKEPRASADESLVESLLDDSEDTIS
jgi:hypothetical protein